MPANNTAQKDTSISSLRDKFRAKFTQANQQPGQAYTDKTVSLGLVNELNDHELQALASRNYIPDPRPVADERFLPVLETIERSAMETINNIADAERLKALDPNIKRVEAIITSSIMSPNDMQDVDPDLVIDMPDIGEDKKTKISAFLSKFYCGEYELRKRMTRWVKEAHFRSGAGVTIILPEATLASLINTYDPDRRSLQNLQQRVGNEGALPQIRNECLDIVTSQQFFDRVCDYSPYKSGYESVIPRRATGPQGIPINAKDNVSKDEDPLGSEHEALLARILEDVTPEAIKHDKKLMEKHRSGVESIALNFAKSLATKKDPSEQRFVKILDNPDILRVGKLVQQKQNNKFHDLVDNSVLSSLLKLHHNDFNENMAYSDIPVMDLTGFMTDYKDSKAFPLVMDVPTESFIPVCTPGDKSRLLGGFLLTDGYGQFIEASGYIANSADPSSNRISVAYNAMYGSEPTESGIRTTAGLGMVAGTYPSNCGCNKASLIKIFNYVLDEMLKKRLTDIGLSDVTIGRYNAIAQCMLHRLLDKKHTRLIFIPEKYITYMTFERHFDGTGKSKIEDILYMESLKISFLTASTLAAMKNAVPVKKVKVNLDPKQRNSMQVVMQLRDAIIQREKVTPSTWPASISSQLQTQNLSIESSHPNNEGFSYTVEDTHREIPKADTEFLEKIDNAGIIGLGLMPSALQESSEVQFARSLATTNLYYAKGIRQDQLILEEHSTAHVRRHASLSSVIIYGIAKILKDTPQETDNTPHKGDNDSFNDYKPQVSDGSTTVSRIAKEITAETYAKVLQVIDNLYVRLSPPDVAPEDAQYVILTETIKRIGEYVDAVYPDDLGSFGGDGEDVSNAYKLFKAQIKAQMTRNAANTLGFRGLLSDVPEMNDFIIQNRDKLSTMFGALKGIQESIKRTQQAMSKKQDQNATDDTGDSGGFGNAWS